MHLKERRGSTRSSPSHSQVIIFDKQGLQAAVYDKGVVRLRHLEVTADNGATVEVRRGLH